MCQKNFTTRTLIIICEKYDLNNNPKFITFEEFKKELEFTISLMTGNINITVIDEIINSIISLENEEKNNEEFNSDIKKQRVKMKMIFLYINQKIALIQFLLIIMIIMKKLV